MHQTQRKPYPRGPNLKKGQHVLPRLAQEEVIEIGHSGHFLMFDNPSGFYEAIARVVKE